MRLIKFITFSHKLHGCTMYEMCDLGTTCPFGFCFLPSPSVDDIHCTSLIRRHGYYFFLLLASVWLLRIRGWLLFQGGVHFFHFTSLIHFIQSFRCAATVQGPQPFEGGDYSRKTIGSIEPNNTLQFSLKKFQFSSFRKTST